MLAEVMTAYGGLKAAAEITQGLLALKTDAAVSSKVVELNGVIAGVQGELFGLQAKFAEMDEQNRALREELGKAKAWAAEKARYELHRFDTGSLACRPRAIAQGLDPRHFVCPNCLEDGKKSILQPEEDVLHERLICLRCKLDIPTKKLPSRNVVDTF